MSHGDKLLAEKDAERAEYVVRRALGEDVGRSPKSAEADWCLAAIRRAERLKVVAEIMEFAERGELQASLEVFERVPLRPHRRWNGAAAGVVLAAQHIEKSVEKL